MSIHKQDCEKNSSLEDDSSDTLRTGTIGTLDFYIWTLIPAIGIIVCVIHAEQEHFWSWTGATSEECQSLKSKIVVSVMSAVIGGCFVATLMKTIFVVSFTLIKYQGANFSHFAAVIRGYSPACLPLLFAGRRWSGILLIFIVLIVGTMTKQLAVVSMGVRAVSFNNTMTSYTRDYKSCSATEYIIGMNEMKPLASLDAFNSLRNRNTTYTNEYYDKSIPDGLRGESKFVRELPFANVSCRIVPKNDSFSDLDPVLPPLNKYDDSGNSFIPWGALIAVSMKMELAEYDLHQWVLCTIDLGHATASTTCQNTLCHTERVSIITPFGKTYTQSSYMLLRNMFTMVKPGTSGTRNILTSWILGADITEYTDIYHKIPGESLQTIEDRVEILGTIIVRILCDYNNKEPYTDIVTIQSNYISFAYYVNRILWKWPFWLLAGFIFVTWITCMISMRITPESRIISVEWLLGQYVSRSRYGYLSGGSLVKAHRDYLLQVVDGNSNGEVGNIAIIQSGTYQDIHTQRVLHDRTYQ
ncbi:uncharacterized protein EV154DRAFT_573299 [Mucor mucedo]|uniref:uncharacterized protein n=1 Tax=Mucor mucedo TaxID=29922 RepID=UPI00221FC7A9|nr:uncharacterized protein EV154DRAFT_573299 [Mucor mucedo]KAI7895486.1 hypothetical protein EV154DRAFT_573299 [Mucor mucedo]